jgi:hypothetical protein
MKPTETDKIEARLINWGRYLRYDPSIKLNYPDHSPFVFSPAKASVYHDEDAEHVEFLVSSLPLMSKKGEVLAFVLKLHYAERWQYIVDKVTDLRRRFNRHYSRSKYYELLSEAKKAIQMLDFS